MSDLLPEVFHHLLPSSALTNCCQLPMPDAQASAKTSKRAAANVEDNQAPVVANTRSKKSRRG
jgi:hypothetical protein